MEEHFELLTDRLVLRPHEESDAEFMVSLNTDPEVTRYLYSTVAPASPPEPLLDLASARRLTHELRRQFRERRMGRFIVLQRVTGERLGWCGLKPVDADPLAADLGYRFLRRSWGQGFATEAARLACPCPCASEACSSRGHGSDTMPARSEGLRAA
jgi:RimJ/RimL family protein N-acetyltransferase